MFSAYEALIAAMEEPAIYVRNGVICALSSGAQALFSHAAVGLSAEACLPPEILALTDPGTLCEGDWGEARRLPADEGAVYLFRSRDPVLDVRMRDLGVHLRTQLATATLAAGKLEPQADREKDYACMLRKSLYSMLRMADHIAFLTTPQTVPDLRSLALCALVEELCSAVETYTGRMIRLVLPEQEPSVWGDENRIRRMLLCILSNAVKFASEGEITVTLKAKKDGVSITVQDPGEMRNSCTPWNLPGLDARRGAGMGLDVARRIAVMHGGTLLLEQRKPRGTRVTVTLKSNVPAVFPLHAPERTAYRMELDPFLEELSDVIPWEKFRSMYED